MMQTINAAKVFCQAQIDAGGSTLPRDEDPFKDDLGYGAAITVASVKPNSPLTWEILKNVMQGLWNYLIIDGRYVEAEFDVWHGDQLRVGRGMIEAAPSFPGTATS